MVGSQSRMSKNGAYVRYPAEDLLRSSRSKANVPARSSSEGWVRWSQGP
jgi:hypothetical protein